MYYIIGVQIHGVYADEILVKTGSVPTVIHVNKTKE